MVFGDTPKGSVEAYNFEDGQSLTTVRKKTAAKEDDLSSVASKSLGNHVWTTLVRFRRHSWQQRFGSLL